MNENKVTTMPQHCGSTTESVDVLYVFTDSVSYREGDPISLEIAVPISTTEQIAPAEDPSAIAIAPSV